MTRNVWEVIVQGSELTSEARLEVGDTGSGPDGGFPASWRIGDTEPRCQVQILRLNASIAANRNAGEENIAVCQVKIRKTVVLIRRWRIELVTYTQVQGQIPTHTVIVLCEEKELSVACRRSYLQRCAACEIVVAEQKTCHSAPTRTLIAGDIPVEIELANRIGSLKKVGVDFVDFRSEFKTMLASD